MVKKGFEYVTDDFKCVLLDYEECKHRVGHQEPKAAMRWITCTECEVPKELERNGEV